jgi:hypothetical protein
MNALHFPSEKHDVLLKQLEDDLHIYSIRSKQDFPNLRKGMSLETNLGHRVYVSKFKQRMINGTSVRVAKLLKLIRL